MTASRKRASSGVEGSTHAINTTLSENARSNLDQEELSEVEKATSILQQIRVELSKVEEAEVLINNIAVQLLAETSSLDKLIQEREQDLIFLEDLNRQYSEKNREIEEAVKNKI